MSACVRACVSERASKYPSQHLQDYAAQMHFGQFQQQLTILKEIKNVSVGYINTQEVVRTPRVSGEPAFEVFLWSPSSIGLYSPL